MAQSVGQKIRCDFKLWNFIKPRNRTKMISKISNPST